MLGTTRGAGDCPDMIRRRAAAATHHVDEAAGGEFSEDGRRFLGRFIIAAEGIRQTRVRVGADIGVGDARHFLDMRAQLPAAERAIQSDHGGPRVPHGIPKGLRGLARQGPARGVGDRA